MKLIETLSDDNKSLKKKFNNLFFDAISIINN